MAGPIVVSVIGDVRDLVKGTGTARGELTGLAKVADRAGKIIAGGLLAGGGAAVAFGAKSVKAASEAQQSVGASEAVFGKYADTVVRRSQEAATAVGLSANEYRELNNVTGAMLASAGTPLAKVADLTDDLTKRAADLAATFGGTTREAVQAMGSLLRGEADPIERYGISIKQSDVNARLAAKGLDKLTGKARKQAEQTERLALLFQQSSKSAGQFGRESDTLAHKQQVLGAKMTDLQAKVGGILLPALADLADVASDKAVPALEDLADWLADNRDEFSDVASTVKSTVLPVLEGVGDVVSGLAGFWADLPGPVKSAGVQLGIAALVFPRVAAGITGMSTAITFNIARLKQLQAEMTYTATRSAMLTGAMTRMGAASRNAAGIAGMAALTVSAGSSNEAISRLGQTAGGALAGFAVGGPIGAPIGAAAGLLLSLATSTDKAKDAMSGAGPAAADYASSLDQISGAATRATRAVALKAAQDSGALQSAHAIGISSRDFVSALLGQEAALQRVNAAIAAQPREQLANGFTRLGSDASAVNAVLIEQTTELERQARETRAAALATGNLSQVMRGVPKNIATRVSQEGNPARLTDLLRGYVRQGKLVPKQIKTIVTATGLAPAGADVDQFVRRLVRSARNADTAGKATGDGYAKGTRTGISRGKGAISNEAGKVVSGAARSASGKARTGGSGVGHDLAAGTAAGISGGSGLVASAAAAIINAALAAMRVAADSHSPSRESRSIGYDLGDGLTIGVRSRGGAANAAGEALIEDVLGAMRQGAAGVNTVIDRLSARAVAAYNKAHKRNLSAKQVAELNRALDKAGASLAKIANQYARTLELAKQTTAAARAFANITTLADFGVGAASGADGIVNGLEARLTAIRAFQADLSKLAAQGINKTTLEQLLTAGVDGGAAYAAALASGGADAIAQVNDLQRQINAATQSLGDRIAPQVTGLDPAAVAKAAQNAAAVIARVLRRRLGVNIRVDASGVGRAQIRDNRTPVRTDAGRAAPINVTAAIKLTAQQVSQLERGRQISADLKAYRKAGGR